MKIYIDFDGTIFNSTKHYLEFIKIFKKYNIKKEDIEKIMKKAYNTDKNLDNIAKKIIKENNIDESIYTDLEKVYNKKLLFKDSINFLNKYYQKYDLILLTLGDKQYQQKKINAVKISKYFKEIIITNQDKSKLNIDYLNGIFIDNNPIELNKFYNSNAKEIIRIKRETDKYSKLTLNIDNAKEFNNFDELIKNNYIEKIGEKQYE